MRSQRALLRVSGRVRYEDLRVEIAAELALLRGPQVRAFAVPRSRLLRLVLFDHDQPVRPFVQGLELNAWFVVNPGDRRLEGRDHLGAVLGTGKAVTTTTTLMSDSFLRSAIILSVVCAEFSARLIPPSSVLGRFGQLTGLCGWLELHLAPVLRTAGPVVQLGPHCCCCGDRGRSVIGNHDCFDEDHPVVRLAEGVLRG